MLLDDNDYDYHQVTVELYCSTAVYSGGETHTVDG